jgi:acetyl esterase/lipase
MAGNKMLWITAFSIIALVAVAMAAFFALQFFAENPIENGNNDGRNPPPIQQAQYCGNSRCESGENAISCSQDCSGIDYNGSGSQQQVLNLYLPSESGNGPRPVLIHFHGGYWLIGGNDESAETLQDFSARNNVVVIEPEYRLVILEETMQRIENEYIPDVYCPSHTQVQCSVAKARQKVLFNILRKLETDFGDNIPPSTPIPQITDDGKAVLKWVEKHAAEYNLDAGKICVSGYSAGGHMASFLGTNDETSGKIKCVVDYSGPSSLVSQFTPPDMLNYVQGRLLDVSTWSGAPPLGAFFPYMSEEEIIALGQELFVGKVYGNDTDSYYRKYSPIDNVSANDPPFMIVMGTRDAQVPFHQSYDLYYKLLGARGVSQNGINAIKGKVDALVDEQEPEEIRLELFENSGVQRPDKLIVAKGGGHVGINPPDITIFSNPELADDPERFILRNLEGSGN